MIRRQQQAVITRRVVRLRRHRHAGEHVRASRSGEALCVSCGVCWPQYVGSLMRQQPYRARTLYFPVASARRVTTAAPVKSIKRCPSHPAVTHLAQSASLTCDTRVCESQYDVAKRMHSVAVARAGSMCGLVPLGFGRTTEGSHLSHAHSVLSIRRPARARHAPSPCRAYSSAHPRACTSARFELAMRVFDNPTTRGNPPLFDLLVNRTGDDSVLSPCLDRDRQMECPTARVAGRNPFSATTARRTDRADAVQSTRSHLRVRHRSSIEVIPERAATRFTPSSQPRPTPFCAMRGQ
jgi:hypothetical protein